MTLIANRPFMIPRGTSQLVFTPAYEKPLLQLTYNTNGDRATWVKELEEWPDGCTPASRERERHIDGEIQRLAATYGYEKFRKVYPADHLFEQAFEACKTLTIPGEATAIPDTTQTDGQLIAEILALNVPSLTEPQAAKIVKKGHTVDSLAQVDATAISSQAGLPLALCKTIIEAAKMHAASEALPHSPVASMPSIFKPTVLEPASA